MKIEAGTSIEKDWRLHGELAAPPYDLASALRRPFTQAIAAQAFHWWAHLGAPGICRPLTLYLATPGTRY
jgi:hypothetical protein